MLEAFASALAGDDRQVRSLAGPDGVVCVAAELSSVFVVRAEAGGAQEGTLAIVGDSGGGIVSTVPLPRSFRVRHIDHDSGRFTVTSSDGRRAYGTPWQFAAHPKIVEEQHNASYQEHLERAFLATHLFPVGPRPGACPPLADPVLGEIRFDHDVSYYSATVRAAGRDLWVSFDTAGPDLVAELLPHAGRLVTAFDRVHRDGLAFLWSWGAEGDESDEERERFGHQMRPDGLVVYRSGDFEVHYDDTSGEYFLDGYWPAVVYRGDMTPLTVTVEA